MFNDPCEMTMETSRPTKEKVREYMERRRTERRDSARSPIHDIDQIRKELGWDLNDRRKDDRRKD
jgi:hypothetical protein